MSFSEFMTARRFNQKTVKEDLFVKANHVHPRRNRPRKTLEQSRRQHTATRNETLQGRAGRPHLQADRPMGPPCQPLLATSVLHRLKDQIYAIA
jgi:hypothetical protein